MLSTANLIAFVATENRPVAKAFYQDTLGLKLISEDPFACVFDAHGVMLRLVGVAHRAPAPYTVLGWEVAEIAATVQKMRDAGIEFERYSGLQQNEAGIWAAPGGAFVAWFKDPDGNLLSLSQHPRE